MADRRYETLVLIHPEQGEPGAKELTTRIRSLIEDQGGTIEPGAGVGDCASSRIPIAKQRRAFYVLFEYRVGAGGAARDRAQPQLMDPCSASSRCGRPRTRRRRRCANSAPTRARGDGEADEAPDVDFEAVEGEGA